MFPCVARFLAVLIVLPTMSSMAQAQIEPALPGSVEYSLLSNHQSWIEVSDPITTGIYVEDLLTNRLNQPAGRGYIGIVAGTSFDQDYGEMAATVDFGRNYSVGIVFSELTAVRIIPEPSALLLSAGGLLCAAKVRGRRRTPPNDYLIRSPDDDPSRLARKSKFNNRRTSWGVSSGTR